MNYLLKSQKIGFIGAGNMTQAIISGLLKKDLIRADHIFVSNRSPGKLQKLVDEFKINPVSTNESLVETCDIIVLATKPQDLIGVIEPLGRSFDKDKIVVSLAAGVRMATLQKYIVNCRWVRLMPNTANLVGKGAIAYLCDDEDEKEYVAGIVEDLFSGIGTLLAMENEDQLEAFMVACSSGTGFVFELMLYWQDWIEEHDFDPVIAKRITIETFLGAATLAQNAKDLSLEEQQSRVATRKGVTMAGLESMRDLEIERALRISFEKSAMRNSEIAREMK